MSNAFILGLGTIIFGVTVWATLVFGYARFGAWYDRDVAEEYERRKASTPEGATVRTSDLPHDDIGKVQRAAAEGAT